MPNDRAATEKKNAIFQSSHNQTEPSLDGEAVTKAIKFLAAFKTHFANQKSAACNKILRSD